MGRRWIGTDDRHRVQELSDLDAGEHRLDAIDRLGGTRVDRPDPAVGNIAPPEGQVTQTHELDVVNVRTLPLDETRVFPSF